MLTFDDEVGKDRRDKVRSMGDTLPYWRTLPLFPVGLLFHVDGLSVEEVIIEDHDVTLVITATGHSAACPRCTHASTRVHSCYLRTLHDLPWADMAVTFRLHVRRFRCTNPSCPQVIFAERFVNLARVRARRTDRQREALE